MSLINDALKKAQQNRGGGLMPPPMMAYQAATGSDRERQNFWKIIIVATASAVAASAIVAFVLLNALSPAEPDGQKDTEPEAAAAAEVGDPASGASEPETQANATGESINSPEVARTSKDPETAPERPAAPPALGPDGQPLPNPAVFEFLKKLEIRAVKQDNSKVLLSNGLYRVNYTVDEQLGLKIYRISQNRIEFIDENGITYVKEVTFF